MLRVLAELVGKADVAQMLRRLLEDGMSRRERFQHVESELAVALGERGDLDVLEEREAGEYLRRLEDPRDAFLDDRVGGEAARSEEHTSELRSLLRRSYAAFC